MSDAVADVKYRLVPDVDRAAARRAGDEIGGELEHSVAGRSAGMAAVGRGLMGALAVGAGAVVGGGFIANALVGSASDLEETRAAVSQIFGSSAAELEGWARSAAGTFGQSQQQALNAAKTFAIFGQAAGLSGGDLVGFSSGLTELASDLASFNNTSPEQAIEAIGAALRGESEPIRAYGVMLDDATLKAHAMEMGIYDGNGALTQQQRVLAAQQAILAQTSNQQGDFARTSDGLANRQRVLAARFEDVKATLGQALLPVALRVAEGIGQAFTGLQPHIERFAEWLGERLPPFMNRVGEVAGVVFGWLRENVPPIFERVQAVAAAVFPALVAAFEAVSAKVREVWPQVREIVTGVVEAVQAVIERTVDVVTFVWENFGDNILNAVEGAWAAIEQVISGALDVIQGIIDVFVGVFTGDWGRAWDGIKGIVDGVWQAINGIIDAAWNQIKAVVGVAAETLGMILSGAWDAITRKVHEAWSGILGFFAGAWSGITSGASAMLESVVGFFSSLPGRILGAVGDLSTLLIRAGVAVVQGLYHGVTALWDTVAGWFRGIPSRITGAIGDLSRVLWNIGKSIIEGLFNGMKSAWNTGKSWLGGIGSQITRLKGPPEHDKTILVGNGQLIMQGLARGLQQGWDTLVEPALRDRTLEIGAGGVGTFGATPIRATPQQAVAAATVVNLTIQAWPGTDAARVGREAAAAIRAGLRELEAAQA